LSRIPIRQGKALLVQACSVAMGAREAYRNSYSKGAKTC
jgi:hypothetical protein